MKKKYCCLQLEDAILRGSIREEVIVLGKPEHDIYIAEFVTFKGTQKLPFFREREEIRTKEILLKHCIFCWKRIDGE